MRHGETALNDPTNPRLRAWKDVPLDEAGKIEVQLTAHRLRPYQPGYIYSSDLMRDTETASIVGGILNLPCETDFDARTMDMGTYEGKLLTDVNPSIAKLFERSWERPPGSSESLDDFARRWQQFLDRKMNMAANIPVMRPILIVTHGKNVALSHAYVNGLRPQDARMPKPAGFAIINVAEDRSLTLEFEGESEPVIEDV